MKKVFRLNNVIQSNSKEKIEIKDEQESGSEYFMFDEDPMAHHKNEINKFSENYYQDRYFVQAKNREFLANAGHARSASKPEIIKHASFEESSGMTKQSEEVITEKDILELPKLSHNGTVVRLNRDKVSVKKLEIIKSEKLMEERLMRIRNLNNDMKNRKLKQFEKAKKEPQVKFKKVVMRRLKIKEDREIGKQIGLNFWSSDFHYYHVL